jgi:hypothetical protein
MASYPLQIRRCQHIKTNGIQCSSPALRAERYCYYHMQLRRRSMEVNLGNHVQEHPIITVPNLEDANSIQAGLAEILRLLATKQIEHRTAALMLHALRTASSNLKHTSFEPEPTHVVIDPDCVERRPIGASAWSTFDGQEYDDLKEDTSNERASGTQKGPIGADIMRLMDLMIFDPAYREQRTLERKRLAERPLHED